MSALALFGITDPISNLFNRLDTNEVDLRLIVCVSDKDCEGTGWFPQRLLPRTTMNGKLEVHSLDVMYISSVCTSIREYEGIKGVSSISSHLKKVIFNRSKHELQCIANISNAEGFVRKPSMLSPSVWKALSEQLNSYQLAPIEKLMTGKVKNNFMLLQGPPGRFF